LEVVWALWTFFWVLLGFFQGFYWVFLGAFVGFFKNPEEMEIYFDKNDLIKKLGITSIKQWQMIFAL
jgi:hypothetical protein